jgi:hypothetical protein
MINLILMEIGSIYCKYCEKVICYIHFARETEFHLCYYEEQVKLNEIFEI